MKKNSRRHVPQPRRIELDYSEKWGKDVEEATRLALADLKIPESEAVVTVLEQPTKGFLGIGAKLAKVRVDMKTQSEDEVGASAESASPSAEAPAEASDGAEKLSVGKVRDLRKNKGDAAAQTAGGSGRSSGRSGDRASGSRRDRDRPSGRSGSDRPGRSEGRGGRRERPERGEERGERYGQGEEGRSESRAYWISSDASNKRGRDGRPPHLKFSESGESAEAEGRDGFADEFASGKRFFLNERPADLRPVSEGNAAETFFRDITSKMGLNIEIRTFENDECVYIEVEGKDSRTVIGKRGQTLDAIQYLTNLVMNKGQDKYIRVIVDVEGYRSRREKTLEQLAVKLAKRVERTGRNVRLEPMNPYERKVIHATLQSNGSISTRSEGEEPYRRVIIERK
jgi:spoIIIJ-associated protein